MKTKKKIINCRLSIVNCLLALLMMSAASMNAQVRIGSLDDPAPGAVLDLKNPADGSYKGGLLLPKVSIADPDNEPIATAITAATDPSALAGLTVYNTAPCKGRNLCLGRK
jgi:hypothetical protein